jgi:hypothetical protein
VPTAGVHAGPTRFFREFYFEKNKWQKSSRPLFLNASNVHDGLIDEGLMLSANLDKILRRGLVYYKKGDASGSISSLAEGRCV